MLPKLYFLVFASLFFTSVSAQKQKLKDLNLIVGTYTKTNSEGIYSFKFNTSTGAFKATSIAKNIVNPSFLAFSPDGNFVYSVAEIEKEGAVYAYKLNKETGELAQIDKRSTKGAYLCHIAIDKTGKWIVVSSYGGGSLSVLAILPDGKLGEVSQHIQHQGKGINVQRQESSHVHSTSFSPNNEEIFVADLGTDKIMTYQFDEKTGLLTSPNPAFTEVKTGSGPRHFTFHPKGLFAYVIQELSSEITVFDYQNGKLITKQSISTLPTDYQGENSCADIHISPDGKFLYGSNRIHDSIVIYAINPETGLLTYIGNEPTQGKKPRNFMISPTGNFLLVGNMETDNIIIFRRNSKTGKLKATGKQIEMPMPVCLKVGFE